MRKLSCPLAYHDYVVICHHDKHCHAPRNTMTEIGMPPECQCQGPAVARRPALPTPLMCTYYVMAAKLFWANSPNIGKHFMATAGNVSPNTPSDRQLPFGQSVPHAICHEDGQGYLSRQQNPPAAYCCVPSSRLCIRMPRDFFCLFDEVVYVPVFCCALFGLRRL